MVPKIDWDELDVENVITGVCIALCFLLLAGLGFLLGLYFVTKFGLAVTVACVITVAVAVYLGIWFAQKFFD